MSDAFDIEAELSEAEFLATLARDADCDLLLDVNNLYVCGTNHGFDPYAYLSVLPADRVREIHLAGYEEHDDYLFDTHGYRVRPQVWKLYAAALERFGAVPTLIEWDTDIPALDVLLDEADKARKMMRALEAAA